MKLYLKEVSTKDEKILATIHQWKEAETQRERYTCRPVPPLKSLEEHIHTMKNRLEQRIIRIFVLVDGHESLYGKVTAFDFNSRNHSAEFGYYLPQIYRGKGYGSLLIKMFLNIMFQDNTWQLNKLYATTASGNFPSVKLLECHGFHLDGVIREHYWIEGHIQDQLHFSILKREYNSGMLLDVLIP